LRLVLRPAAAHRPSYDERRQWLAVSVPMLVLSVVQELMNQLDIILLGQLADSKQAALFAASWRLASLVPFALVGLATMAGPLIAAAYDRGSADELRRVSKVVARTGFAFALLGAAGLYLLGGLLLGWFGPGFEAGRNVLSILLLGGVVNAFTGVVAYYATLTGRERPALAIFAGALLVSIGLNLLLIPRLGAVGAAIASSSATAAWNVAMLVYVRRTIGIDASALALAPKFAPTKG
jgi:O-antigen/teichoic acid export membrane protein